MPISESRRSIQARRIPFGTEQVSSLAHSLPSLPARNDRPEDLYRAAHGARFSTTAGSFRVARQADAQTHLAELVLQARAGDGVTPVNIIQATAARLDGETIVARFSSWGADSLRLQDRLSIQKMWNDLGSDKFSAEAWVSEAERQGTRLQAVYPFIRFMDEAGLLDLTSGQNAKIEFPINKRTVLARAIPREALIQANAFGRWLNQEGYSNTGSLPSLSRLRAIFEMAVEKWTDKDVLESCVSQLPNGSRTYALRTALNRYLEFLAETLTYPHQTLLDAFRVWLEAQGRSYGRIYYNIHEASLVLSEIPEDVSYEEIVERLACSDPALPVHGIPKHRQFVRFLYITGRVAEIPSEFKVHFADDSDGHVKRQLLVKFKKWLVGREKYAENTALYCLKRIRFLIALAGVNWRQPEQLWELAKMQKNLTFYKMAMGVFLRFLMHFKYLDDIPESLRVGQRETVPRNLSPIPASIQATVQQFGTWLIEGGLSLGIQPLFVMRAAYRDLGDQWQEPQMLVDWARQGSTDAMKRLRLYVVRRFIQYLVVQGTIAVFPDSLLDKPYKKRQSN